MENKEQFRCFYITYCLLILLLLKHIVSFKNKKKLSCLCMYLKFMLFKTKIMIVFKQVILVYQYVEDTDM